MDHLHRLLRRNPVQDCPPASTAAAGQGAPLGFGTDLLDRGRPGCEIAQEVESDFTGVDQGHVPFECFFLQDGPDLSGKDHCQPDRQAVQQQRETPSRNEKTCYGLQHVI